ncbi:T9SS type A sorting domain-containing protein [Flavobacteriaceae bacterium GSB9]|nr:T9SS type A sorting domain-containing protein [Flavobacteriaceae bacterium GSB9]
MKRIILLFFVVSTTLLNGQILSESFDDVSSLSDWKFINVSEPIGTYQWQQGTGELGPHSGSETSYIATNAQSVSGTGTNSDWLILPALSLKDGDKVSFYTIAATPQTFPDRLEVRLSTNVESSADPTDSNSVGDYTNLLLEINPDLTAGIYPTEYTQYEATITGIGTTPVNARIAFRYYVTDGGPTGPNSNGIAIDTLEITSGTLSTQETSALSQFKYYYNEVNQVLNLISADVKLENVNIYNAMGQIVLNKKLNSSSKELNVSSLMNGLYIVKASLSNEQTKTFKFIK